MSIPAGLMPLEDLFAAPSRVFRVPVYQRAYAWQEAQLSDFFEDLWGVDSGRSHFFGTALFQEAVESEDVQYIDVVDGQQRLTTAVVLARVLTKELERTDPDLAQKYRGIFLNSYGSNKLRVQSYDNEFFDQAILGYAPQPGALVNTPSQGRLLSARIFFERKSSALSRDEQVRLLRSIGRAKLLTYSVRDEEEAAQIFQTTNDRGRGLTKLEKVKSFMMYRSYAVGSGTKDRIRDLSDRFGQIYRSLLDYEEKIEEDRVLQYDFIARREWQGGQKQKEYRKPVVTLKTRLNELVQEHDSDGVAEFIDVYTKGLWLSYANMGEIATGAVGESLKRLQLVGRVANFYPLLLKAFELDQTSDRRLFRVLANLLERTSVRTYALGGRTTRLGREVFYRLARDFDGDWHQLLNEITDRANHWVSDSDFEDDLRRSNFYKKVRSRDQYYLFCEYENHLRSMSPKMPPFGCREYIGSTDKTRPSIEHIAPQTPEDTRKILGDIVRIPPYTTEFQEEYLHSIGNLAIDPLSANAAKQNVDFDRKDEGFFQKSVFRQHHVLRDYLSDGEWGETAIESRADDLVEFALERWRVSKDIWLPILS